MSTIQKIILLLTAFLLSVTTLLRAQDPSAYELSVYGAGGVSSLQYKLNTGNSAHGKGGHLGIGFTYFLSPHVGIVTGAEMGMYTAKSSLKKDLVHSYTTSAITPAADNNMLFTYTLAGYEEQQQATFFTIPLMLQFQTDGQNKLYFSCGAKIALPVSATYKTAPYKLTTTGYFAAEDRTYDDLPMYGFGQYNHQIITGKKIDFNIGKIAAAETGVRWQFNDETILYTGVYIDYGLNSIQKTTSISQPALVEYTNGVPPDLHSMLYSQVGGKAFTDKINLMAAGIKIKYVFGRRIMERGMRCPRN